MPRQTNSPKKTSLNAVEQYELNQWLEQNHINSTNLRRSFTDVLPLARLMARFYPELIDLNYYPPRNSVHNKLCNWESFNKRVLARLGVNLTREQMVRVARSVPGSVDMLLHNIMRVQLASERKAREEQDSTDDDDVDDDADAQVIDAPPVVVVGPGVDDKNKVNAIDDNDNADADDADAGSVVPPKPNMPKTLKQAQAVLKHSQMSQHGHRVANAATAIMQRQRGSNSDVAGASGLNVPHRQRGEQQQNQHQRLVLYSHYMQAVNQLQQKKAKIARFDQMSAHLENMLQLKCDRIDELQQQVANAVHRLKPITTHTHQHTHNNNNTSHTHAQSHTPVHTHKRHTRLRKRIRVARNNSIEHKMGTIPIPGIGIAGANFPVKLSQFH